jgi:hypothetical protein
VNGARIGTRFLRCALFAAAATVAAPSPAAGQAAPPVAGQTVPVAAGKRPLGKLEQESVDDAMKTLGAPMIDPAPQGKTIGRVLVVNEDVFSQRDWYFQIFNIFHRTTRSYMLERELLFRAGDVYDQALVEESTRNLQSPPPLVINRRPLFQPELSSVVAILPLASAVPGQVDVLLVTRDVWSLRLNTTFEYQGNELTLLQTSFSENNLFGWRKYLAATFSFDQGAYYYGPQYFDPNIAGTRLQLWLSATLYNSRATHDYEGNSEIASLRYPFYSLATCWAGGVDVVHSNTIFRDFLGNSLRPVDLTATPAMEAIPLEYRRRIMIVDGNIARSVGSAALIQRVAAGYLVDSRHSEVPPDFADPALAPEFLAEYAPISETKSEPYLRYTMFTPRYVVLRDLDTFELRENRQLGPSLVVQAGEGLPALGADRQALDLAGQAQYGIGPAGSFAFLKLYGEARLWDGQWIDQRGTVTAYLATPILGRLLRVVTQAQLDSYRADTRRSAIVVGGSTGLRGYAIGEFRGTTAFVGHVEVRTRAVPLWSQRFGTLLFYDVGNAAPSFDQLYLRNDVGLGLRWLIVQANSAVLRFDWAVPLQDGTVTRAGFPGRLSAGFEQVF